MKTLIVDGRRCKTREKTHAYLARKPFFPPYYGKNLDALSDVLASRGEPLHIRVRYGASIEANLGDYGRKLLNVLSQAAEGNENITLEIK